MDQYGGSGLPREALSAAGFCGRFTIPLRIAIARAHWRQRGRRLSKVSGQKGDSPNDGRGAEEGKERCARQRSAERAAPARTRRTGLGGEIRRGRPARLRRCAQPCRFRPSRRSTSRRRIVSVACSSGRGSTRKNGATGSSGATRNTSCLPCWAEFAGKANLIYIDPPFDTGADFSFTATVPDDPDTIDDNSFTFTKEPSIIEHKAYRDTWGRGLEFIPAMAL